MTDTIECTSVLHRARIDRAIFYAPEKRQISSDERAVITHLKYPLFHAFGFRVFLGQELAHARKTNELKSVAKHSCRSSPKERTSMASGDTLSLPASDVKESHARGLCGEKASCSMAARIRQIVYRISVR